MSSLFGKEQKEETGLFNIEFRYSAFLAFCIIFFYLVNFKGKKQQGHLQLSELPNNLVSAENNFQLEMFPAVEH